MLRHLATWRGTLTRNWLHAMAWHVPCRVSTSKYNHVTLTRGHVTLKRFGCFECNRYTSRGIPRHVVGFRGRFPWEFGWEVTSAHRGDPYDMPWHPAASHESCRDLLRKAAACHVGCRGMPRDATTWHVRRRGVPRDAAASHEMPYDTPRKAK